MHRALHLMHEVVDGQLCDRTGQRIGRVDAIVLEPRDGKPPRIATILVGGPIRARRTGRIMIAISHLMRTLFRVRGGGVSRIPFSAVRVIGDSIELDVERADLPSEHVERRLARLVCRIPGAQGEKK